MARSPQPPASTPLDSVIHTYPPSPVDTHIHPSPHLQQGRERRCHKAAAAPALGRLPRHGHQPPPQRPMLQQQHLGGEWAQLAATTATEPAWPSHAGGRILLALFFQPEGAGQEAEGGGPGGQALPLSITGNLGLGMCVCQCVGSLQ